MWLLYWKTFMLLFNLPQVYDMVNKGFENGIVKL